MRAASADAEVEVGFEDEVGGEVEVGVGVGVGAGDEVDGWLAAGEGWCKSRLRGEGTRASECNPA